MGTVRRGSGVARMGVVGRCHIIGRLRLASLRSDADQARPMLQAATATPSTQHMRGSYLAPLSWPSSRRPEEQ